MKFDWKKWCITQKAITGLDELFELYVMPKWNALHETEDGAIEQSSDWKYIRINHKKFKYTHYYIKLDTQTAEEVMRIFEKGRIKK